MKSSLYVCTLQLSDLVTDRGLRRLVNKTQPYHIVITVMGMTGTSKSPFSVILAGSDVYMGYGLTSYKYLALFLGAETVSC